MRHPSASGRLRHGAVPRIMAGICPGRDLRTAGGSYAARGMGTGRALTGTSNVPLPMRPPVSSAKCSAIRASGQPSTLFASMISSMVNTVFIFTSPSPCPNAKADPSKIVRNELEQRRPRGAATMPGSGSYLPRGAPWGKIGFDLGRTPVRIDLSPRSPPAVAQMKCPASRSPPYLTGGRKRSARREGLPHLADGFLFGQQAIVGTFPMTSSGQKSHRLCRKV